MSITQSIVAILIAPLRTIREAFTDLGLGACWGIFTALLTALSFAIPTPLNLAIFVILWVIIASLFFGWRWHDVQLSHLDRSEPTGLLSGYVLSIPWAALLTNFLYHLFQLLLPS